MTTIQPTFDFAALRRAIEGRDVTGQLALYAEDAEVRLVDQNNPPREPRLLRGKDAIREWIEDVCARDMTHRVEHEVVSADRAAFTEACRYPDGVNVLCSAVLEIQNGQIVSELGVQAWDA
jgi:ketosteroid isomerase-like protein